MGAGGSINRYKTTPFYEPVICKYCKSADRSSDKCESCGAPKPVKILYESVSACHSASYATNMVSTYESTVNYSTPIRHEYRKLHSRKLSEDDNSGIASAIGIASAFDNSAISSDTSPDYSGGGGDFSGGGASGTW